MSSPLLSRPDDESLGASNEPVLAVGNIQGNILPGFNKDFQTLLFLKIADDRVDDFKRWLRWLTPSVATSEEVIAFNRLFKATRQRRGYEGVVRATWVNIALSFDGLAKLTQDADSFIDEPFKQGLAQRSQSLGDPSDDDAEGNARNWVIGGPGNEADVVLIIESDDQDDLVAEVTRLEDSIFVFRVDGHQARSGAQLVFKQQGAVLPGSMAGHEHFGFLDGISQPGLRGRLSDAPTDVLTPRQNPDDRNQGKPGQDLLWPGEFVFGYSGQDPGGGVPEEGPVSHAGPDWANDGSFLVLRRLRQDVHGFHKFLHDTGVDLALDPAFVGAKLVGRWPTGAPVLRAVCDDDAALANDDCANNHFKFEESVEPVSTHQRQSPADCSDDQFPTPPPDPDGRLCPLSAHVRKVYPRDDTSDTVPTLGVGSTQTHRLVRRGIPYGPPSNSSPHAPYADSADRGLLFLAYQTSFEEQFEFVTRNWVGNPDFKHPKAGHDPIIGQNNSESGGRERHFRVTFNGDDCGDQGVTLIASTDWVIPTGGGYFFAPSIAALRDVLSG